MKETDDGISCLMQSCLFTESVLVPLSLAQQNASRWLFSVPYYSPSSTIPSREVSQSSIWIHTSSSRLRKVMSIWLIFILCNFLISPKNYSAKPLSYMYCYFTEWHTFVLAFLKWKAVAQQLHIALLRIQLKLFCHPT